MKRFVLTDVAEPILAELKNRSQFSSNQDKENGKFEEQDLSQELCKKFKKYTENSRNKNKTQGIKRWTGSEDRVVGAKILRENLRKINKSYQFMAGLKKTQRLRF